MTYVFLYVPKPEWYGCDFCAAPSFSIMAVDACRSYFQLDYRSASPLATSNLDWPTAAASKHSITAAITPIAVIS